jgi:DNA polymerase III subunit gamma/tau
VGLALYRKYRPATFADVVGQEHVTEPLRTALAAGRINHAYLFSGPRGCGKTSSARILARSLNCVQGPTPDPCGVCGSCVALAPEGPGSLDVVELDAASHGGVDDTRDLRDRAFYMPAESRFRVFIIDEAHMVTPQGFNALLKIVEEPPEHLVFIFATTEPDKVLTTIRSRTHHYPFRLIPPTTLRTLLERLCKEEGATVEPAVFPLVIRAGGGSARDSLSMLDQLLSGAGPEGVTYRHAVALLGVTDAALLDEMVDAIAAADGASVFGAVDKVVEAGHDPRRFAADLLQRLRDLLILDAVPDAAAKGLIDCPEDQLVSMAGQADRLGVATLTRLAEVMHTGLVEMRGTTSPRLVLELMCARMLLPAASADDGALLQRLERMERRMSIAADPAVERAGAGRSPPAPPGDPEPVPDRAQRPGTEPAARFADPRHGPGLGLPRRPAGPSAAATGVLASAPPTGRQGSARPQAVIEPTSAVGAESPASGLSPEAIDVTDVRRVWAEVLRAVQRNRRTTQVLLQPATIIGVEQGVLRLEMQSAALARLVVEPANADPLKAALREVLGVSWTVRCEAADAGAAGQSGNAAATSSGTDRADRDRRNDPPPPPPEEDDIPDDYGEPIDPSAPPPVVRDPEEAAIELLTTELGARRLDPPA